MEGSYKDLYTMAPDLKECIPVEEIKPCMELETNHELKGATEVNIIEMPFMK